MPAHAHPNHGYTYGVCVCVRVCVCVSVWVCVYLCVSALLKNEMLW